MLQKHRVFDAHANEPLDQTVQSLITCPCLFQGLLAARQQELWVGAGNETIHSPIGLCSCVICCMKECCSDRKGCA